MVASVWSGFAVAAVAAALAVFVFGMWKVCVSAAKSVRRRRTLMAARALLRADRPSDDQSWSIDDWAWALNQIGTSDALEQSEFHDKLRNGRPRLRLVR